MGFSLADIDRILEVYDDRDQLEQFFSARQRELEAIYLSHMCALDHAYARLMHARLIRTHTVATGADSCDYWYVPDKSETESESASGSIFNTVRRKKCAVKGTGTKIILEVQKKQKEDYKYIFVTYNDDPGRSGLFPASGKVRKNGRSVV